MILISFFQIVIVILDINFLTNGNGKQGKILEENTL
jgi:hypothetical protein